jgi:hypothetical protein
VHLVTVEPTPEIVTRLRDKLVADIALNRQTLAMYKTALADDQKRATDLDRLKTLMYNELQAGGQVAVDAKSAYQALYGTSAPTPRTLPGDRTMFFDPLRADQPYCPAGATTPQEGGALTRADLDRVSADLAATQKDIVQWPSLISQLDQQINNADGVRQQLDDWLFTN